MSSPPTPWVNTWWKHVWQQLQVWVCWDKSLPTLHTLIGQHLPISSVQNCSSSVELCGVCWWTAIFQSCHRSSIGLRSGLWLSHSGTFIFLFLSHSSVALAVCYGSLSCWKVNFQPNFSILAEGQQVFFSDFSILLHPFSLPSRQVPQSLLMINIPITRCCHHYASQ